MHHTVERGAIGRGLGKVAHDDAKGDLAAFAPVRPVQFDGKLAAVLAPGDQHGGVGLGHIALQGPTHARAGHAAVLFGQQVIEGGADHVFLRPAEHQGGLRVAGGQKAFLIAA